MRLGNMIRRYRKENSLTQVDLAGKLFVTPQAISKWEQGKSLPAKESYDELSVMLGVSINFLMDEENFIHKVKANETLFRISVVTSVPSDELIRLNNKKDSKIEVGEILYLK